jgi:inorganic pyrophosphatase
MKRLMPASPHTAHPWHGIDWGSKAPNLVTVYVEIVPTDTVKYELDKESGLLRVDRPQRFSNVCPALYGFVPKTLSDSEVAKRCELKTGKKGLRGDQDPMDICVLTERVIAHGQLLVTARPIGGLRMLDGDEVDDKIIAVLDGDAVYGSLDDVAKCPSEVLDRLRHYFLTYKQGPDQMAKATEISEMYGRVEALEVLKLSRKDYDVRFAG